MGKKQEDNGGEDVAPILLPGEIFNPETGEVTQEGQELAVVNNPAPVVALKTGASDFFSGNNASNEVLLTVPAFNFSDEDPFFMGIYVRKGEDLQTAEYPDPIATHVIQRVIETKDGFQQGSAYRLVESARLEALDALRPGDYVKIRYLGQKKGKNGRTYKDFEVRKSSGA
jgi:hypothetical protein